MKNDINSLYSDISELLEDICSFLSNNTENGQFKTSSQDLAAKLINRCKSQLQEIAKVNTNDNDSNRYMDMHGSNGNSDYLIPYTKNEEPQEIYADVSQETQIVKIICPYATMPASKVYKNEKSGYLERKDKFLFIDIQRKFFGTLCNEWLLLYSNEKDLKPIETIYLKHYQALEVEKKHFCFKLMPKFLSRDNYDIKPQFFTATTKKDMGQWVSFINKISLTDIEKTNSLDNIQLSPIPPTNSEQLEIYEELEQEKHRFGSNPKSPLKSKPILPPRIPDDSRTAPNMPLPDTPETTEDIYDFIGGPEEEEEYTALNIKEDTEDEAIYESGGDEIYHMAIEEEESIYDIIEPATQNNVDNGEELYDVVHVDEIVEKPVVEKPPPLKPKMMPKPKTFGFGKRS